MNGPYGLLTADAIGLIVESVVARACRKIESMRYSYKWTAKPGYSGQEDGYTTADTAAQKIYIDMIHRAFPGYGIIAEELGVRVACTLEGMHAYFTIDPLDGTRAFRRGQSFGVGTMIALVIDGVVACAYVGDAYTGETFGYYPESPQVNWWEGDNLVKNLAEVDYAKPLDRQELLLREMPHRYHPIIEALAGSCGPYRKVETTSGSIGLSVSRLWRGEVGAHATTSIVKDTPWDSTPVIGISRKLDMVFLRPNELGTELVPYEPTLPTDIVASGHDTIIVHASNVDELCRAAMRLAS